MDISTFRWILIIAGVAIVAYIFLFGNPDRKRKPRASRKRNKMTRKRREPTLHSENHDSSLDDSEGADVDEVGQAELEIDTPPEESEEDQVPLGPPPDKIVPLFLQARDNHRISGRRLEIRHGFRRPGYFPPGDG
jgi:FtsZ-interacting cell division protein ZipA